MPATLTIDSRGFRRALEGLASITGADLKHVIRAEAGSILKACAGQTKVATQAQATQRAIDRALGNKGLGLTSATAPGDITINTGRRGPFGRLWVRSPATRRGTGRPYRLAGKLGESTHAFTPERYHWRGPTWTDITEAATDAVYQLSKLIPAALRAIGLARQSWVQIADAAGIRLEDVPGGRLSAAGLAKARSALASSGRPHVNGLARQHAEARAYILTLVNRLPYGTAIQLDRILARNINARAKFYRENLARGVFNHLATTARAYPGLAVQLRAA